jgi:DNA-binding NtrC family response regulator
MPEMNGLVFLRALDQSYPGMKVILISAYAGIDSYLDAIKLDALEYLNKPVKFGDLKAIITRMFNQAGSLGCSQLYSDRRLL